MEKFAQPRINKMDCFDSAAPASRDLCKRGDMTICMMNSCVCRWPTCLCEWMLF